VTLSAYTEKILKPEYPDENEETAEEEANPAQNHNDDH